MKACGAGIKNIHGRLNYDTKIQRLFAIPKPPVCNRTNSTEIRFESIVAKIKKCRKIEVE